MSIPSEPSTAKDCPKILNAKFLKEWIWWSESDPWALVPQIQQITARSLRRSCCSLVYVLQSPSFATLEHNWANARCLHLATHLGWEVSGGEDRQKSPELSPGCTTSGGNGTVIDSTRAQHVIQVAEGGLHIKRGVVHTYFSNFIAIDGPSLTFTPGTDIVWIGHKSTSDAAALREPTVCTESTRWHCRDWHHWDRQHRGYSPNCNAPSDLSQNFAHQNHSLI